MTEPQKRPFRPRARLFQLLGEHLIGSPRLAVFELVKNAYDADASSVTVRLNLKGPNPTIVVQDDGEGMDLETLQTVWLEPGADFREIQKRENRRTRRFNRLPLGEKGVGRFAAHKLGQRIVLVTRRKGQPEYKVEIDWASLMKSRYMDEAEIAIESSQAQVFAGQKTGTRITISGLREKWSRAEVRKLYSNLMSVCSPFTDTNDAFRVNFELPGFEDRLENLLTPDDVTNHAMWVFWFWFENGKFDWRYQFKPIPHLASKLEGRELSEKGETLLLIPEIDEERGKPLSKKKIAADAKLSEGIGPITGTFYVYDRDKEVLRLMPQAPALESFLDENGGIRVFRDGIRVYNYGEKGNDWLNLDIRRVNIPTRRISNNIVLGLIELSMSDSSGLIEKTNREGFVENQEFANFKRIVLSALAKMENLRRDDKERIKAVLSDPRGRTTFDIQKPIESLKNELKKRNLERELGAYVNAVEKSYKEMQQVMTQSGVAGLNVAVVFHELERGVRELHNGMESGLPVAQLRDQSHRLIELLSGFSLLLRRDAKRKHNVKDILKEALLLNEARFRYHGIAVSCPVLTGEEPSFEVHASFGMLLGALSNIFDNALYWLRVRWPDENKMTRTGKRRLYIGTNNEVGAGHAIIVTGRTVLDTAFHELSSGIKKCGIKFWVAIRQSKFPPDHISKDRVNVNRCA